MAKQILLIGTFIIGLMILSGGLYYQYTGIDEGVVGYEQYVDPGFIAPHCKIGLKQISEASISDNGIDCQEDYHSFRCTQCGNGTCGSGENHCNCPIDCNKPN